MIFIHFYLYYVKYFLYILNELFPLLRALNTIQLIFCARIKLVKTLCTFFSSPWWLRMNNKLLRFLYVLILVYSACKFNVGHYERYVSDSHEDFHSIQIGRKRTLLPYFSLIVFLLLLVAYSWMGLKNWVYKLRKASRNLGGLTN